MSVVLTVWRVKWALHQQINYSCRLTDNKRSITSIFYHLNSRYTCNLDFLTLPTGNRLYAYTFCITKSPDDVDNQTMKHNLKNITLGYYYPSLSCWCSLTKQINYRLLSHIQTPTQPPATIHACFFPSKNHNKK